MMQPSVHLPGGRFDLRAQNPVQAAPCHDVRFAPENSGGGFLHLHQRKKSKRSLGMIKEQIDVRIQYGEDRFITAGHLAGRCVVLVWTPRGGARRIISMRYAHADEEANWFT
jgi:uncharacterized DUF497 family protein